MRIEKVGEKVFCWPFLCFFLWMIVGISGCNRQDETHPTGKWEFWGEIQPGVRGIVRVEIQKGPFLKYIGFRENTTPLSETYSKQIILDMERIWRNAPEELVQFQKDGFYGYGGKTDGVLYFSWNKAKNTLQSAKEDSMGIELKPVKDFRPFRFPVSPE